MSPWGVKRKSAGPVGIQRNDPHLPVTSSRLPLTISMVIPSGRRRRMPSCVPLHSGSSRCRGLSVCTAPTESRTHAMDHTEEQKRRYQGNRLSGHLPHRSLTTSPARINPATEGTKAVEPGISLRTVHFRVPGGQMQCFRQLINGSSRGRVGCSVE